jgi:hypothetical protein
MTLLFAALSVPLVLAQDESLSYEGGLGGNAPGYVVGKPVSVSHASGNLQVRCMDVESLSGRLQYTVFGSAEGPVESFGKGIGIAVSGDSKGGSVRTRVPSVSSGVARAQIDLTVNIPRGAAGLTVSHTGSGWVQVVGCGGPVKVTAGGGGAYVGGPMTSFVVSATGGDVKIEVEETVIAGTSSATSPGALTVSLSAAQNGKIAVKGEEVSVRHLVMGTNDPSLVSGQMGSGGPSITLTAKGRAEVVQP